MAVIVDKYSDATRSYIQYRLYSKKEIKHEWSMFKEIHLKNMREGKPYVTCTVIYEEEALVLIALMMRRTKAIPACFYYDEDTKKILANCQMIGCTVDELHNSYLFIIARFLGDETLRYMDRDPVGNELFLDPTAPLKPAKPEIIPWVRKLHSHIGMLDNVTGRPF
jgi:hypothetical protein